MALAPAHAGMRDLLADFGSDDFARYHDLHPAVLLASRRGGIVRDRQRLAEALRGQRRVGQSLRDQVLAHGVSALFR